MCLLPDRFVLVSPAFSYSKIKIGIIRLKLSFVTIFVAFNTNICVIQRPCAKRL